MFPIKVEGISDFHNNNSDIAHNITQPSYCYQSWTNLQSLPESWNYPNYHNVVQFEDQRSNILLSNYFRESENQPPTFASVSGNLMCCGATRNEHSSVILSHITGRSTAVEVPDTVEPENINLKNVSDLFQNDGINNGQFENGANFNAQYVHTEYINNNLIQYVTKTDPVDERNVVKVEHDPNSQLSSRNRRKENRVLRNWVNSHSPVSSSDDVDVVTVTKEFPNPCQPNFQMPLKKGQKSKQQNNKRNEENSMPLKSVNVTRTRNETPVASTSGTCKKKKNCRKSSTLLSSSWSASSSSSSSHFEELEQRTYHKVYERQRRATERTALQNLKKCFPDIQNLNTSTIKILQCATEEIRKLEQQSRDLDSEEKDLKCTNKSLRKEFKSAVKKFKIPAKDL